MHNLYEYELGHAALVLCKELLKLEPGETCIITADTESDPRVANAIASACFSCSAKPMVVTTATPPGVGKAADANLPIEALTGALREADAWIELNNKWLLYSTPYDIALRENPGLRHKCLVGMTVDMMVRCIGRIDHKLLGEFLEKVYDMTVKAKRFRFTTPAGGNLEFENSSDPNRVYGIDNGYADVPGSHMMSGQIGWTPEWDTINGKIVFDGSLDPPIGLLDEPVVLTIEKGKVKKIEGVIYWRMRGCGDQRSGVLEISARVSSHPMVFRLPPTQTGFALTHPHGSMERSCSMKARSFTLISSSFQKSLENRSLYGMILARNGFLICLDMVFNLV
jgi:2,5-dihydroxypyridine 5,6-dioxygenase